MPLATLRTDLTERFGLRGVPLDTVCNLDDPRFSRQLVAELVSLALRPDRGDGVTAGFGGKACMEIADTLIRARQARQ
jgi:hypothetical protein